MADAATWRSSCENELAVSTSFIAGRRRTTTRTRSPSADAPRGEGSSLVLRRLRGGLGSFVGVARFGLDARGVLLRFGEAARITYSRRARVGGGRAAAAAAVKSAGKYLRRGEVEAKGCWPPASSRETQSSYLIYVHSPLGQASTRKDAQPQALYLRDRIRRASASASGSTSVFGCRPLCAPRARRRGRPAPPRPPPGSCPLDSAAA